MTLKLIKDHDDYHLVNDKQFIIGTTDKSILSCTDNYKLSLKNCQAIERGYDLDELAEDYAKIYHYPDSIAKGLINKKTCDYFDEAYETIKIFKDGFQKALEILGDKKFSEEDMKNLINQSREKQPYNFDGKSTEYKFSEDELIQSLQQTEWDVEIEMICPHPMDTYRCGLKYGCDGDGCNHPEQVPYLDTDGRLILKRK